MVFQRRLMSGDPPESTTPSRISRSPDSRPERPSVAIPAMGKQGMARGITRECMGEGAQSLHAPDPTRLGVRGMSPVSAAASGPP
jgi:hypothetical protein